MIPHLLQWTDSARLHISLHVQKQMMLFEWQIYFSEMLYQPQNCFKLRCLILWDLFGGNLTHFKYSNTSHPKLMNKQRWVQKPGLLAGEQVKLGVWCYHKLKLLITAWLTKKIASCLWCQPQHVLDLVSLPADSCMSDDGEAFPERIEDPFMYEQLSKLAITKQSSS